MIWKPWSCMGPSQLILRLVDLYFRNRIINIMVHILIQEQAWLVDTRLSLLIYVRVPFVSSVITHNNAKPGLMELMWNFEIQLTVTGQTGRTGATVLSRVVAVCKIDQGLVPIPLHSLEESLVLGRVTKHVHVTKSLAQVNTCLLLWW